MGIAYTGKPIVFRRIKTNSASSVLIRGELDQALLDAGWQHVRAVDKGFVYVLTSPQEFEARCLIQDQNTHGYGGKYLVVQFMSFDEAVHGIAHNILWDSCAGLMQDSKINDTGYQIVANCCQMFLSVPGVNETAVLFDASCSVAGGIPYLPPGKGSECAASAGKTEPTIDCWWSCGNGSEVFSNSPDFRSARVCLNTWGACKNGSLSQTVPQYDWSGSGVLQLFTLTEPEFVEQYMWTRGWVPPKIQRYGTLEPMRLHAFIGWLSKIQGQIWDAFLLSSIQTMDAQIVFDDTDATGKSGPITAIVWGFGNPSGDRGAGTWLGTLCLVIADLNANAGAWNIAY